MGSNARPTRDTFLDHATGILETATASPSQEDWTILVGQNGQLEMLAAEVAAGWRLDSLARERGARMAFRVKHSTDTVHIEGRQGSRSCSFAAEASNAVMQRALSGPAFYRLLA